MIRNRKIGWWKVEHESGGSIPAEAKLIAKVFFSHIFAEHLRARRVITIFKPDRASLSIGARSFRFSSCPTSSRSRLVARIFATATARGWRRVERIIDSTDKIVRESTPLSSISKFLRPLLEITVIGRTCDHSKRNETTLHAAIEKERSDKISRILLIEKYETSRDNW